ncbi:MAG TPA: lipocalin-like domain-containing protein [Burkholderiales bacterium]|nr:lipocalin-like domain-containing protein [Burkholderiales bacterium]
MRRDSGSNAGNSAGKGSSRFVVALVFALAPIVAYGQNDYPQVRPGVALQFPRDRGSHPQFRNEWWYITGWLKAGDGKELGVQITFFRNRPDIAEQLTSRFAPRQLLLAHAALADPQVGRLLHDQRSARSGLGLAEAEQGRTDVAIEDWSLKETASGYAAQVAARDFSYALRFEAKQAVMLQGERGFSRKGPKPAQASYYYSLPQLAVSGSVVIGGRELQVSGVAWLDHEWSSEPLAEEVVGWDWVGINFADGGALMAFRMRSADGGSFWTGGALHGADGRVRTLKPGEVQFATHKRWRSPRTGAEYPVSVRVTAGRLILDMEPLMEDQELDARASTGTVYWEGAVRARQGDRVVGQGYLELTGYWKPLKL